MSEGVALTLDNYLCIKSSVHQKDLKRVVDHTKFDYTEKFSSSDKKWRDQKMTVEKAEELHLRKLFEYIKPKEFDVVVYYDNIGALSGRAGYLLIRDGYIISESTERIS